MHSSKQNSLFFFQQDEKTLFSIVPSELFPLINQYDKLEQLLRHVAFGERDQAEKLIKQDPHLLRFKCIPVLTPSGLLIDYPITAYECALLSGNDKMAEMISRYFPEIRDEKGCIIGEQYRHEQNAFCRPHIEKAMETKPSDIQYLLDIINTTPDKVLYALIIDDLLSLMSPDERKDYQGEKLINYLAEILDINQSTARTLTASSFLLNIDEKKQYDALVESVNTFKNDRRQLKASSPAMHYNYMEIQNLYDIYVKKFNSPLRWKQNPRMLLFWQKIIGTEQRNLPARDRQILVFGLNRMYNSQGETLLDAPCTFKHRGNNEGNFPCCLDKGYASDSLDLGKTLAFSSGGLKKHSCLAPENGISMEKKLRTVFAFKFEKLRQLTCSPAAEIARSPNAAEIGSFSL